MTYSIGSKVKCVDKYKAFGGITVGDYYTVKGFWHDPDGEAYYALINDKGMVRNYLASNFVSDYDFSAPEPGPLHNVHMRGSFPA